MSVATFRAGMSKATAAHNAEAREQLMGWAVN